jgi:hypothetical protein
MATLAVDLAEGASGLAPDDYPTQRMLRVRYQGEGEEGSFRVILRLLDPDHFQLIAVDPLGRTLWGLAYDTDEVHFINYRQGLECRSSGSVVLTSVVLDTLPVRDLPAVLLGRLPATVRSANQMGQTRLVDDRGREWTVTEDRGEVQHWTLWRDEEPLMWFQRVNDGGLLSHRGGGQFRWRESLREELLEMPETLTRPETVRSVSCDTFTDGSHEGR